MGARSTTSILAPVDTLLCIGAHSDDIEIGAGGTILRIIEENPGLQVWWVVLGCAGVRAEEAASAAQLFLEGVEQRHVMVHGFRDGYFPTALAEIKDGFERLKGLVSPGLILTHCREDYHQDHRVVAELTWNTFRSHRILEYEIPKYEGLMVQPNCFVTLDEATARRKVDHLMKAFASQRSKHWFTPDTFTGLMRLRGIESGAPGRFAEGFTARKIVF